MIVTVIERASATEALFPLTLIVIFDSNYLCGIYSADKNEPEQPVIRKPKTALERII